jgi:hypothetical protein
LQTLTNIEKPEAATAGARDDGSGIEPIAVVTHLERKPIAQTA